MAPLLVILPFGPFLAWKRGDFVAVAQRLAIAAGLALFAAILFFVLAGASVSLAPLGLLLGLWVCLGAIAELADRGKVGRVPPLQSVRRLTGLPRTAWATALAHFGVGVTVLGIVATTAWETEVITTMAPGETREIAGYSVAFDGLTHVEGPNFVSDTGRFTIITRDGEARAVTPERRVCVASGMPTTEAAIETFGFSQVYLQLGEAADRGQVVRLWHKPFITLIWIGALIMAAAGLLSLTYRRLRVGAPRPAAQRTAPAE
jgi:cytochrome c-type biogenesis protein CcmF